MGIVVDGNAGDYTGITSSGGKRVVHKERKSRGTNAKAAIFCKGKKVN